MADKKRILIVTQEMKPYTLLSQMSEVVREYSQYIQESGVEVRILMPRFGTINERRHRLHEVVRLSGMNINVDDDDYPLIIKVASLPGTRMQVYFLDNEDFFKRKQMFETADKVFFEDNWPHAIFLQRGSRNGEEIWLGSRHRSCPRLDDEPVACALKNYLS